MITVSVGDNSPMAPRILPVTVPPGVTVTLTNVSGSPLSWSDGINAAGTGLAVGNNVVLTRGCWIKSLGISLVQLTGGHYGK